MSELTRIEIRRDNAATWADINPVLLQGEPALETDTRLQKIGDGQTAWNDLPYEETIDAAFVATGTLDVDRIPDLDAAQTTSGTFDAARIPSLPASKITSGTLDTARIPALDAAKITSGTLDAARIPDLSADYLPISTRNFAITDPSDSGGTTVAFSRGGSDSSFYAAAASDGDTVTFGLVMDSGSHVANQSFDGTDVTFTNNIGDWKFADPTHFADVVHFDNTSATSATAGTHGAVPSQVAGYIEAVVNGTAVRIPYYLP